MGANGRQPRVVRCASVGVFAGSIMEELRRAVFGGTVEVPAKRAPRSAGSQKEATPTSPSCTGALRQSQTHPLPGSRRSGWWSILVPLFRSGNPGRWLPEPDQVSRSPGFPCDGPTTRRDRIIRIADSVSPCQALLCRSSFGAASSPFSIAGCSRHAGQALSSLSLARRVGERQ